MPLFSILFLSDRFDNFQSALGSDLGVPASTQQYIFCMFSYATKLTCVIFRLLQVDSNLTAVAME